MLPNSSPPKSEQPKEENPSEDTTPTALTEKGSESLLGK